MALAGLHRAIVALTHIQLATYLLEVREVVQLMLGRFADIRELSDRWVRAKNSEDRQLEEWEAGQGLDDHESMPL